ncbi:MAG: hypothetical protein JO167_14750 [Alphaproteobacteria bacterium]|nr:hypothetical protein [Alphaproteobacteria bacterium]
MSVAAAARADASPARAPVGTLERLPKWLNLVPMVVQWLWLSLRHGSLTLPSAANPALTCGGMVGDGKLEYFDIMGARAKAVTAPYTFVDNEGVASIGAALAAIHDAKLDFPLIAKPNLGWCGFGVRLLRDSEDLRRYLIHSPSGERIVLQQFVPDEGEAGLYYVRPPGAERGRIVGILLRSFPRVVGDGRRSIAELMAADERLRRLGRDGLSEPCCDTARVPNAGEVVRVATIGSTRVGGLYQDGSGLVTDALSAAIDDIARDMTDFHIGRFDVRFSSLASLRNGEEFTIIEVNGAGSEAVQAWDPALTLREAYAIVFAKQRLLFELGSAMRRNGHKPARLIELGRHFFRQQRLIRAYPPSN